MSALQHLKRTKCVRLLFAVAILTIATACAVKLAPSYDKSIIVGLTQANTEVLTLFSSVSEGTDGKQFSEREATYNSIIGQFDGLRAQVAARPVPRSLVAEWLGLGTTNAKTVDEIDQIPKLDGPSEEVLLEIVRILTQLKTTDEVGTLDANKLLGLRNAYEISFQQVLTYENALER